MKGLTDIPSFTQLSKAYRALETQRPSISEIILFTQWSRLDPRLAELLIKKFVTSWRDYSPVDLNSEIKKMPWPAALGVLLSITEFYISSSDLMLFRAWKNCTLASVIPAQGELYFFGTRTPGSTLVLKDVTMSLKPYSQWGYYGRDPLGSKLEVSNRTRLEKKMRMKILKDLLKKRSHVSVKDYREALSQMVSTRVAELDLKSLPGLKAVGRTKGLVYKKTRNMMKKI